MRLLREFVDECLDGDWDRLADIDPSGCYDPNKPIAGSDWLKCPGRNFDCDDCELSRAVYREVWGVEFPQFRGDTMNSFRTVFGRERITRRVVDVPWAFAGSAADERFSLPDQLRDRIRDFFWTYHTIGNFIPLPNVAVDGKTLNMYRAGIWKDSFGAFLAAIRMYLEGRGMNCGRLEVPPAFVRLMDANAFFWDRYRGRFEDYVRDFFLEGYLDDFGRVIDMPRVYWWDKSLSADKYIAVAMQFLDLSEEVIANRAQRIIMALQMNGGNPVECPYESI